MKFRIPSWESIRKIGQSKILGLTILVPILGYMILFNEQLVHYFELSKDIFTSTVIDASPDGVNISNDNKSRLFYFYFGFSFLGFGSLIYQLFCPSIIKEHSSDREFIRDGLSLMTEKRIDLVRRYLGQKVDESLFPELADLKQRFKIAKEMNLEHGTKHRELAAKDLMLMQWQYENWSYFIARIFIFALYLLGFGILAIPTLEMFKNVLYAYFT